MSPWHLAGVAVTAAVAAWYWSSPWPVVIAAAYVAAAAVQMARAADQHSALLWALSRPARPMQMHWSLRVVLTERALETLNVPVAERQEIQRRFGEYAPESMKKYLFVGHPAPAWISRSVLVNYERWGESLERWTIYNTWGGGGWGEPHTHHETRTYECLPAVDDIEIVDLWGATAGVHFRYEDGRLVFLNVDENVSLMPDRKLYVKDGARVLFDVPAPSLSMRRRDWRFGDELWKFLTPNDPPDEGYNPFDYWRSYGKERFHREDWERGFRWDLEVHDLRTSLPARVTSIRRSLWRRRVKSLLLQLEAGGLKVRVDPAVIDGYADKPRIPKVGQSVSVVFNDEGEIDRVWAYFGSPSTGKARSASPT